MTLAEHVTRHDGPRDQEAGRRRKPKPVRTWLAAAALGCLLAALPTAGFGCRPSTDAQATPPKPPEVTVSQALQRPVIDYEEFTGRLEAVEFVEIRSRVHGFLDAVHFTDGEEVTGGALLFEIDPRPFEAELKNAEGQQAQWMAKRDKAKADVARYENLVPTGAASAQDLDKSRAELAEAIAAIESAGALIDTAKLNLEFSKITAPIAGQVGRALISKGNLISPGEGSGALLATIVSLDPMYVYFDVNERTLLRFRDRHRAASLDGKILPTVTDLKIPVSIGLSNDEGFPHQGGIDFADNRVDPETGSIQVRASLDNSKRQFKPGLFARVRVPVSGSYEAVLVSQMALGTDQGQKYVLVVNDQNVVERRFVKPGPPQDDGLQVIAEGLQPGEWIVVNGLQRARPGKPVEPQRAEMPTRQIKAIPSARTPQPAAPSATAQGGN